MNSEAKMQVQGTFVADLTFKVLQLTKNERLTVADADAADVLSGWESSVHNMPHRLSIL